MGSGADKGENLEKIRAMTRAAAAAGARLTVFPEGAMVHLTDPDQPLAPFAEPLGGPFVETLQGLSAEHSMAILCGVYEPDGEGRAYNTIAALDQGRLIGSYRKIHLYDAFGHQESRRIRPGSGETLGFELDGLRIGVMTCYDVRFPELARRLVDEGAQAIVMPSGWVRGLLKEEHWEVLVRARAIENTCYLLAADQVGGIYVGSSMVVDPLGVVRFRGGEGEELVVGEVDAERVAQVRRSVPSLQHRRIGLAPAAAPAR
jgi:predicted amidohydrolase